MNVLIVYEKKNSEEILLGDLLKRNGKTLLYFYPKNNTPWCTVEAKDFSEYKSEFEKKWIKIVGVSKDSEKSHCNFMEKQELNIALVSDPELELHKKYEAWGEKKNYGKVYIWAIRSTFLLDENGEILQEWRNVRAKGHVEKVLRELE